MGDVEERGGSDPSLLQLPDTDTDRSVLPGFTNTARSQPTMVLQPEDQAATRLVRRTRRSRNAHRLRAVAAEAHVSGAVELSVIAPVYNEEGNLRPLQERLTATLQSLKRTYEIIYVDDGSSDASFAELDAIATSDERVRVVRLRRNFGQTSAIAAGIEHASGRLLVFIDADLQNDPANTAHRPICWRAEA